MRRATVRQSIAVDSLGFAVDLRAWRETSRWRPIAQCAVTTAAWIGALVIGLWADNVLVQALMALPLSLASGQLFTIGHDAGHGSFSASRRANAVIGRIALFPSLHVFGLWRAHHAIHHRYTNLRGHDFVWTPLSVTQYRALPRWRQAVHRLYRNQSGLGLGLQYAIEIWMPRMLWPHDRRNPAERRTFLADAALLYGGWLAVGYSAYRLVAVVEPARAGQNPFWIATIVLLFVVPLLLTQWMIGFVIYLNHTHPDLVWYDDPAEWSRHPVQLEGSATQRFPRLSQILLPRRIMNHTAHHIDPAVPLRHLAAAQQQVVGVAGDQVTSYDWSLRALRQILVACKLYDYDEQRWLTYAAADEAAAT